MGLTVGDITKVNLAQLQQSLKLTEQSWDEDCATSDFFASISKSIRTLSQLAKSEPYLLRDWVWVNAQFRIAHPKNEETARIAWSALVVFITMVQHLRDGGQDTLSEICWLTDQTVEMLLDQVGSQAINIFISHEEHRRIDDLLLELAEYEKENLEELVTSANTTSEEFSKIHHAAYFPSIEAKLSKLIDAAAEDSEAGHWARAALRYVHLKQDVINDNQGYIGYLDDIHVIENIYGLVFGELPWKRLVEQASEKWPFLVRTYWRDGDTKNHLTPLLKTALSCCLGSFLENDRTRNIVLPEVGPCGFLTVAAFVMANVDSVAGGTIPPPGSFVSFRDGHTPRYAVMERPFHTDGAMFHMIRLRDLTTSISSDHAMLLEPANSMDTALATHRQFKEWLSRIKADTRTAARRFHRKDTRTSVLYVTSRANFYSFLEHVKPYGRRLDELVTVEYRTRGNKTSSGSGAGATNPSIIVCNDLDVAESILRDGNGNSCAPRNLIIDRHVDHITLTGLINRSRQYNKDLKIVTLSEVDIGVPFYKNIPNESTWMIQPEEINPLQKITNPTHDSPPGKGPLASFSRRLNRAYRVKFKTHIVEFPEIDKFCELATEIAKRAAKQIDTELLPFAINSEAIIKLLSTHPPVGDNMESERLISGLTNLSQHARVKGIYDEDIKLLADHARDLISAIKDKNPKALALLNILSEQNNCCVVVASRSIADSLARADYNNKHVRTIFTPVHGLETIENIDALIIPGWFGKKEMLRLQVGGWSDTQIRLFYKFEYQRLKNLNLKLDRAVDYLNERTKESWRVFSVNNPDIGSPPTPQKKFTSEARSPEKISDDDDQQEAEYLVELAIRNQLTIQTKKQTYRTSVNGRIVFFDDGQHYGLFAKFANLICLNEVLGGGHNLSELSEAEAERLIWKPVKHLEIGDVLAFPDDTTLGDVVDKLADAILNDEGVTRQKANLWREHLKTLYKKCNRNMKILKSKLSQFNVEREFSTLDLWIYTTKAVAPQNPKETITRILECCGIQNSLVLSQEINKAVKSVYTARRKAGHYLVSQLCTASLSTLGDNAIVQIGNKKIRYKVLTISSIGEFKDIDASLLGIHSMMRDLNVGKL